MGYYTQYVFTLEEGPEEQYRSMTREIDGILSCYDLSLYESVYAKWYDYEEDMERLSRAYPEITVRVNGSERIRTTCGRTSGITESGSASVSGSRTTRT